jgi:hypothetical protein
MSPLVVLPSVPGSVSKVENYLKVGQFCFASILGENTEERNLEIPKLPLLLEMILMQKHHLIRANWWEKENRSLSLDHFDAAELI